MQIFIDRDMSLSEELMMQPEALIFSSRLPNNIKEKLMKMEFVQSDEQICKYLSLKWALARALRYSIGYLEEKVKIQLTGPRPMDQEIQMIKDGLAARKEELTTTLGEIALINCPIDAFVFRMSDCL
ncbi:uncharacterized protein TNCV_894401 [Trichonephila clavipes]|nr:uncharacterized protein TNCV_894401 [Trichonephila clavipes]